MKTSLSLTEMAAELERQASAKRDFVADTRMIEVVDADKIDLKLPSGPVEMKSGEIFRSQLASHYKVPREYAERIRASYPKLYADTFNTHLSGEPVRRMVRTLDGSARAFLSDRYRPLDNADLAGAVLPALLNRSDIVVRSSAITERRFYLKASSSRIVAEVRRGDVLEIGIAISNSEIGDGSLSVSPFLRRCVCDNGMIIDDYGQKKYHVGKRASGEENAYELYTDRTKQLDDAAFFAKVRDTVAGVLTQQTLDKVVAKMKEATEQKLDAGKLTEIVEVTAKKFGYNETTQGGILRNLIEGADLTRYGLMNAITRQSADEESYDVATKMELDGSRIIELAPTQWRELALAA
jgi:hypothetical protein